MSDTNRNFIKLNLSKYLVTLIFFIYYITCVGQEVSLNKIKEFIPKHVSETSVYKGNLNYDEFEDIVLRFKIVNESEEREHFHLLLGQKNGMYKLSSKNDFFTEDNVDGTSFYRVIIKNGYFSIEYTGGGNTSGSYKAITFKYSKEKENWLLHKVVSVLVHRYSDTEPIEDINTQKDFGKITFKDYGIDSNTKVEIDFYLTDRKEIILAIKNNLYEPIIINSFIFGIPSLTLTIKDKNNNIIGMPPPPILPENLKFHEKIIKGRGNLKIPIGAINEIVSKVPEEDIEIRATGYYKTLETYELNKIISEWVIIEKHNFVYKHEKNN
ncbi:hypothetical protein [Tenacibaculum jejuense]|uniref:Uncharacterized protein n=1 Tax=Tenacibaculum jejuense TaxID=584609 RepID=A0A238U5V8_9FLAO|nr:hypothetical protein [Tenacibaculum jejuense]SNR13874.1 protein of unknown function [Tenacibaculum jejuense]